eukprot:488034-Prymnesium_polylepis.1
MAPPETPPPPPARSFSRGEKLFVARARLCEGDEGALNKLDDANTPSVAVERATRQQASQNGAQLFLKRSALLDGDANLSAELRPDEWAKLHAEAERWEALKAERQTQAKEAALRAREARARAASAATEAEAEAA